MHQNPYKNKNKGDFEFEDNEEVYVDKQINGKFPRTIPVDTNNLNASQFKVGDVIDVLVCICWIFHVFFFCRKTPTIKPLIANKTNKNQRMVNINGTIPLCVLSTKTD